MEPIYAVKSTYDEDMFYHQVVASKPRMMPKEGDGKKIKFQLPDFGLKDTLMALLVGAAVYMAFGQLEQSTRILQAVLCGLVVAVVLRRMNERQNGETSGKKANSVSADKNQALQLLESSGLKGDRCTMNFYEDTFTIPVRGNRMDQGDQQVLHGLLEQIPCDPCGEGGILPRKEGDIRIFP